MSHDASKDNLVAGTVSRKWAKGTGGPSGDECQNLVAHSLTSRADSSEDGTGRGTPIIAFDTRQDPVSSEEVALAVNCGRPTQSVLLREDCLADGASHAIRRGTGGRSKIHVQVGQTVRRITPLEAERLFGLPDQYTSVPYRGKPMSDSGRYKVLGNSIAINCLRWIGERIHQFQELAE